MLPIKSLGFTLLEIMITLSLGMMLLVGIYEVLQSARYNFNYIQGTMTLQENGQLAAFILRQQLTQAGYIGCRHLDENFHVVSQMAGINVNANSVIHGYNSKTIAGYSKDIAKKIVLNTDAIMVAAMANNTANLAQPIINGNLQLSLTANLPIKTNEAVMIADCKQAEINVAAATMKSTQLAVRYPVRGYVAGATIAHYQEDTFYIGKTERSDLAGDPIDALYLHHINGVDEELLEGVDNLQIYYATLQDEHMIKFEPANAIQNWSAVKMLQIYILLDSLEPLLAKPQKIHFVNSIWQAPDRRLYKQWVITINLPNR